MASKDYAWMKFYTQTWLSHPQLRMCSDAERGILMDLMCVAHQGSPYGYLTRSGVPLEEKELRSVTGLHYQTLRKRLKSLREKRRINYIVRESCTDRIQISHYAPEYDPLILRAETEMLTIICATDCPIYYIPRMVRDGIKHQIAVELGLKGWEAKLAKTLKGPLKAEAKGWLKLDVEKEKEVKREDTPQSPSESAGSASSGSSGEDLLYHPCLHLGPPPEDCPKCKGKGTYYVGPPPPPADPPPTDGEDIPF